MAEQKGELERLINETESARAIGGYVGVLGVLRDISEGIPAFVDAALEHGRENPQDLARVTRIHVSSLQGAFKDTPLWNENAGLYLAGSAEDINRVYQQLFPAIDKPMQAELRRDRARHLQLLAALTGNLLYTHQAIAELSEGIQLLEQALSDADISDSRTVDRIRSARGLSQLERYGLEQRVANRRVMRQRRHDLGSGYEEVIAAGEGGADRYRAAAFIAMGYALKGADIPFALRTARDFLRFNRQFNMENRENGIHQSVTSYVERKRRNARNERSRRRSFIQSGANISNYEIAIQ